MDFVLNPLDSADTGSAVAALAHNVCNSRHPDHQVVCTGFNNMNGTFLVSCAGCRSEVWDAYKALLAN